MTSCEIKAKETIAEDIKSKALSNKSWNAQFSIKDNTVRVFFPFTEKPTTLKLENTVAYKNAKQFKNLLESTYKPTIYKETGFINKNTKNGIEIAYNIPFKLIKDQELRNNTTEGKEFKALEKLEEQQQEAVNKIVYENLEDYINDEGDAGFKITRVYEDGTIQISKLTRIQDLDELRKKLYKKAEQNYKYSVDLPIEAQERITEQLTGMLMDSVSDDLLNKKQPKIFYKEKVVIDGKEKEIAFLNIRKPLTDRLLELHNKYKNKTLTPKEQDEYFYLRIVWNPKTFLKIQHDIVNRLIARGYKFKNGKAELQQDDANLVDLYEAISDTENQEFELAQDITGKSDQFSDYSALTTSNKEKMSSKLRTFLSSIKSDKEALINLKIGNKVYNTQYINEGVVIQAINEATLGLNTYEEMVEALQLASQYITGREFLSQVVEKLAVEHAKRTEIVNQFVDKFNQQKNDLTLVTFDKKPIVAYKFNKDGKSISVPLKDDNNQTMFFYDYKVINANRNDIFINLKNEVKQRFVEANNLDTEEIPFEKLKNAAAAYTLFKDYVKDNYKGGKFSNVEEAKEKLKELFETLNFEFSDNFYDELVENKRNKLQVTFDLDGKGKSLFNKKFGALHNIFATLESAITEKKNKTLDELFGNSGATKLLKLEAEMKEYFYNTSTLDGKGRNIWGYSMPSPMFRELFDVLNDKDLADLKADSERSLYTSSSYILSELASLSTEERKLFIENIKYSLFNTLKQKSKDGKELTEMEPAEFIATQIILHIGSDIKTGKSTYWSNKFLTTPSDKSTMYIVQTPNTYINVETVNGLVKPKIDLNSDVLARFYNYFLGEYRRAKAYQDADQATKEKIDALNNYEPLLFYNFPQLNLKNDDNILWKRKGDTWVLRDLDEVVGNLDVESYVKSELLQQLKTEVENTRQRLQDVGLIQNNKFINGFPPSYKKRVPDSVSLSTAIKAKEKEFKDLERKDYVDQLKDLYNQSDINLTEYLVHDYALNYLLHNIEMHTLILGDPAQYLKDEKSKFINNSKIFNSNDINQIGQYIDSIEDNLSKRMAGAQANRMEGNTNNESSNIVTIVDTPTTSKIIEEIERFNSDQASKYKGIKSMDGQELMTAEEDLKQKLIHGKISQDLYQTLYDKVQRQHEDIEKEGFVTEENEFTEEELEKFIAQPIKPVVFGNVYEQDLKIFKTTYYKDSAFGLYPQFTQGLELDKVRKGLYNLSKKGIIVDRLVMKSAAKLGIKNPISNVFNSDFTINQAAIEGITEANIDVVPRSLQGIQLEVPYDPTKNEIRIASQQVKLIFNEILNVNWDNQTDLVAKFLPELKNEKVTGKLLKNYHNDIYRKLIENSLSSILDEIGVDVDILEGTYIFKDLNKLKKSLEKTAVSLGYSNLALEGLSITPDGKEFVLPISFNENGDRLEKLLLSILNKAILQKISGRSFILASEMGFVLDKSWINQLREQKPESKDITEGVIEGEEAKRIIKQYKSSIVFTDKFDSDQGLLPARRKDPLDTDSEILPAQVLVSWKFTHNGEKLDINDFITEKDGRKFLDASKINEDILRVLGIRIPVQGHPSMASIEIVGFLPEFMGDIIIAPQDFVAMMGSDFDIDKLYGYMYNYQYNKKTKTLSKLKFDESKVEEIDEEDLFFDSDEDFTDFFDTIEKKKQAREKYIKKQNKKMLQNKLIDIYHAIMLHPAVYDKSLQGITEGNLGELTNELKGIQAKKDYNYYSPFSVVNKIDEYFENKAGKLGVGVFSVNNTFLTVVEDLGLSLKKIVTEKDEDGKDVPVSVPDYFSIPLNKDSKNDPKKYYIISGSVGVNKLISMFQSASVDNAKLKYLNWISVNKDTMGVAAILSSLADDNVLAENGEPLLNEDYIVYFLSQPIIKEYINAINAQNAFSDYVDTDELISNLLNKYETKIKNQAQSLDFEKRVDYLNQLKEDPVYTSEELVDFVKNSLTLSSSDNINYLLAQYQILNKFLKLKDQADVLRQLQYLVNADSNGLPSTLAEANYKSIRTSEFIQKGSPIIENTKRVFVNESGKEVNTNKEITSKKDVSDLSLMTLQGYLENIADSVSTRIFSKNNNIIASGSTHIEYLTNIISTLSGKRTTTYPYNLVNKITKSYLAFLQSTNNLEIQDPGRTFREEIIELLKDTETTTSLATDLENFKKTDQYKQSIILKPFLESLRVRTFEEFKFVEYSASQGLLNTDEQIVQALLELQDLDGKNGTYPLFAKLVKYTFLVKIQKSPVTIKQFIPIYVQEALGITSKLRTMNQFLNSKKEGTEDSDNYEIPLAVVRYEADGDIPVYTYIEQFYQHYPEELKSVGVDDFTFLDDNNKTTDEVTERILIKGEVRQKYTNIINAKEFELPYVTVYNFEEKRPNVFRKVENAEGVYEKIPNLGRYNLDEFNADALSTATSILPSNQVKNLTTVTAPVVTPTVVSIQMQPSNIEKIINGTKTTTTRSESQAKQINIPIGKSAIVNFGGKNFNVTNRGLLNIEEAGGKEAILKSEGVKSESEFMYQQTKDWVNGKGKLYVYDITPTIAPVTTEIKPSIQDQQVKQIVDFYNGLTKEQREKIGNLDDLIKTFREIPFDYDVRSFISEVRERLIVNSEATKVFTNVADNQQAKGNNVLASYGITENQKDQDKIKTILDKISVDSKALYFKELANLLKQLDAQFNFTANLKVNFVENQDSFYNPNDNSINLNVSQKDSQGKPIPPFAERVQFEILHELIHSVLDNRLGLDQAGTIVLNRIKRLTTALESAENLQKAIDLFDLKDDTGNKATVEYLLDKLAKLRATTQDTDSVKYNSEAERSVLNPLINEREFIASVLGDNNTRMWMNEVQYDETGSVLSKILDAFKTFFNNLIRTFGFEVKQKSALQEAINISLDLINYEVPNISETVEFLEFGTYYKFEVDKNGNVIKGEYSQGNKNSYKPLSKASKKYAELVDSPTSKKLTTEEITLTPQVITAPTVSGKTLQGEQVEAFQKAITWLNKSANTETDSNNNLTEEAILDNMFFLSGPGGSGKTFITEIIVSELMKKGAVKLSAAAPTHQAKNVLKENLPKNTPATTVQGLLGMLPNPVNKSTFIGNTLETIENMYYEGKAPFIFNYDYLVIDEASMIDGSQKLVTKEYKRVWSDVKNTYVDQAFYENPDLGTYLKEVLKLKYRLTGKPTKVFLMGDVVQVVPVGSGRFQISKLLTDLLNKSDNNALLNQIRRTDNQEVKMLSMAFRETFNKLFEDNSAKVNFLSILNSVKPNNNITLLNSKKDVIDNFIRLYKENIESGNPVPNYTNIIWYNNSINQKTVDQTKIIRQILFNSDLEINVNENLILKSNYEIKNFFGDGKDLFLGNDTKLIVTTVEDGVSSFTVGKGRKTRIISNIPVKNLKANVQVGSIILKDVPITIVTPSYFEQLGKKFDDKTIFVEGQQLTKQELYQLTEAITNVEYGYVVNSHKIQGSKVINPIVDVENITNSPEDVLHVNNMIYTAISRTVNSLYVYHPQLTPKEGKPISKLTGVNNPQQPIVIEESTTAKELSLDYLNQRLQLQYSKRAKIYSDKTLTEEEKRQKLLPVETIIARLQANIETLNDNFVLAEYFRIAQKELNDLTKILNTSENITEEDLYQAIQIFGYFQKLYSEINQQYTVYNDSFSVGNKKYVDPELYLKVKEYNEAANSMIDKLVNLGLNFYQAIYNKQTGRAIGIAEFLASEQSPWFRKNILSTHESKQQFVRSVSKVVTDMVRQTNQNIIDHEQEDLEQFREFEKSFEFKDLIRLVEYTDPYGVKRKQSTLISRNKIDYYNAKSQIFKDAELISDKNEKSKYIKKELAKISYDIDARFLFVDEYLQEMKEYYKDDTIDWIDNNSETFYLDKISNFHKEQLSEYGDDYAQFRTNEVLKQAKKKIEGYLDKKEAFKMSLETQSLTDQEKKDRLQDWISYNSPFLLLNEIYGFSTEEGANVNKEWKTTPQEVNVKTFTTRSGRVVTERPFIDYKNRKAKDFITNKAKYKFEDGSITGFYDDNYSKMEQEMLEREYRALDLEEKGDQIGADNERKRKIKWDYLKFVEERQKYYLQMLPYHITKELRWFNLVDVQKDYKEQFDEILQPILSFNGSSFLNFLGLDLLKLIKLSLNFIYDKAVKKFFENHIAERKNYYDFVTGQIKLNYDPSGFNNTLNKLGVGDLRTNDVFNYFSYLRNAAIQFQERSQTEELIKIGQFLASNAKIIDASSSGNVELNNTDIDGLNWHINSKLYGAKREEIYKGTEHQLWKTITSKTFALTKAERDKKKLLTQRVAYLKQVLATTSDLKAMTQINNEIYLAELQIESIKKEINKYTMFGSYSWYVALKRLSFGTIGRLLDFLSSAVMGGIKQAIDGRIYGVESYFKALGKMMALYSPNAMSSLTTAAGVTSLNPTLVAAGVTMRFGAGVIDQIARKKEIAKINQILYRLGALDYLNYKEDDNVSSFVNKTNLTDEALAAIKTLSPFSSMSQWEIINKGVPTLAVLYETKIKDLNGKEHSLIDAFDVDENFNLIWKESEFGSQDDAGFNWYKGFNMQKVISNVYAAQTFINGDYDVTKSKYGDTKLTVRALMLLRRFMGEFLKSRFGQASYEEDSGNLYMGSYRGLALTLKRAVPFLKKKDETIEFQRARKAAAKQIFFDVAMLSALGLVGYGLRQSLSGGDDDEKKELNWWETFEYYTISAIDRLLSENFQFIDPNIIKGKANTGVISPILGDLMDLFNLGVSLGQAAVGDDVMTHREMISRNLAPINPKKLVYQKGTKYEFPKWEEKYYDPLTGETFIQKTELTEKGKIRRYKVRVGKYSKNYEEVSRSWYNTKKMIPFMNLYLKYQRDEKKARELKSEE